ncbi:MAG TPA: hypothetical protein PLQ93_07555 [Bacteroidia bacterium]|nr:hypothetical protein [Bacteroidia bacterium]
MNPRLRNGLALAAGVLSGGILNMGIIMVSGSVIPPPEGADVTSMEGLKAALPLFEPKHFIMPFLAHALGTLLGSFVAARLAVNRRLLFALIVGAWFLLGGTLNVFMLPSPLWFNAVDLVCAYLPMAYLGAKLVGSPGHHAT